MSSGVEFEEHREGESSLSQFLQRIKDFDPDIIWISSHGEHKYYNPNESKIIFSENEFLEIKDFNILVNQGSKRRLLFLNTCEGGVHFHSGELKNLGFPNLLVSSNQDVISHLWMAEARFAYVFGVFLALGVSYLEKNFFDAYEYSLSIVLSNKEEILDALESFPLELLDLKERIRNNDGTKWGKLITVGSPVYHI